MRRNKIALLIVTATALVVSACSSPVAPTTSKQDCGNQTGGQICLK